MAIIQERLCQPVDHRRLDQRFVALNIDHNIRRNVLHRRGDAVGPGGVIGRGHHHLSAEFLRHREYRFVIAGDQKTGQKPALL